MIPFLYVTWFIKCRLLYFYMPFLYVKWSSNSLKRHSATSKRTITTNVGGNTYQNEMVAFLHMNQTKVVKATAPKVALMKVTHLNRPRNFSLYDILTNEPSLLITGSKKNIDIWTFVLYYQFEIFCRSLFKFLIGSFTVVLIRNFFPDWEPEVLKQLGPRRNLSGNWWNWCKNESTLGIK